MKKITHQSAGIIFAIVGTAWWLIPMVMHSGHDHHTMEMMDHGPTVLGFTEMTWMWYVMAIVHFFINDVGCLCDACKKKLND